jgi:hypothetical protein
MAMTPSTDTVSGVSTVASAAQDSVVGAADAPSSVPGAPSIPTGGVTIGGGAEGRDTIALAGSLDTLTIPHRKALEDSDVYGAHGTQEGRMTAVAKTQEEEEAEANANTTGGASSVSGAASTGGSASTTNTTSGSRSSTF